MADSKLSSHTVLDVKIDFDMASFAVMFDMRMIALCFQAIKCYITYLFGKLAYFLRDIFMQ